MNNDIGGSTVLNDGYAYNSSNNNNFMGSAY
jgi:hypothetical protein